MPKDHVNSHWTFILEKYLVSFRNDPGALFFDPKAGLVLNWEFMWAHI
jgi:hypothetical protein